MSRYLEMRVVILILAVGLTIQQRFVDFIDDIAEGANLDYSYNETALSSEHYVSVPGCPQSVNGYPWVLYGEHNPRCYLVGHKAHVCKEIDDVMQLRLESQFGVCGCDFQKCLKSDRGKKGNVKESGQYTFCTSASKTCTTYVYDNFSKRCFRLYNQGFCKQGEWLTKDDKGWVECRPRVCATGLEGSNEAEYLVKRYTSSKEVECCKIRSLEPPIFTVSEEGCPRGKVYSDLLWKCIPHLNNTKLIIE